MKALDMKHILSTAKITSGSGANSYNLQSSSRQPATNTSLYDAANAQNTSMANKTMVTDDQQSVSTSTHKQEKLRSISALSNRSTFSMEQKKVQNQQNLSSAMLATKSMSRFHER